MFSAIVLGCLSLPGVGAASVTLSDQTINKLDPSLYGIFFEEINFAGEGGIYAELIRNRDFETLGRGDVGEGRGQANPIYTDFRPWKGFTRGGGKTVVVSLDNTTQPFKTNPTSIKLQIDHTGCQSCVSGISNPGYWGINIVAGSSYDVSFYARASVGTVITLGLVDGDTDCGQATVAGIDGSWKKFTVKVKATATTSKGAFEIGISGVASGERLTVWLDAVSVFPSNAVKGLFRKDLFDKLNALTPSFVRFPGGNYLEGYNLATRWAWKKTIGNWQERSGHYNSAWGYWTNDGLGLHEYLMLCEALGSKPQLSIYTGYSMGQPYVPLNQSQEFIQDAVDSLEYANGAITTKYGGMRRDAGHPEPFGLYRLEVGNEEVQMSGYREHYEAITKAVWQVDPNITVLASGRWGPNIEGSPCLTGLRCDMWDDHYYRTPDQLAAMGNEYDNYDRKLPRVFVGEYAANVGEKETLQAALAEAVFMMNFEENADVVHSSSFAPLFRHVSGTQWGYDLINFNSSNIYVLPSYHVQQAFGNMLGDSTLNIKFDGVTKAVASISAKHGLVIKIINYNGTPSDVAITITGIKLGSKGFVWTLGGEPSQVNTLDNPNNVMPKVSPYTPSPSFKFAMPAWGLAVFQFELP